MEEERAVIPASATSNLLLPVSETLDMWSLLEPGVVESDDPVINPFIEPFPGDLESFFEEQSEIKKEVKLSCLLQLDDTFSTEDRWPI